MAKAIADPAELRRFAQDLKRFNNELQGNLQGLQARMGTLSQSWRDQEQAKFEEEFDATMKTLARFIKASEVHIPFLLRKAQRIEDYLQQR
jgi:WXG100 family type VII secretion target